MRQPVGEHRHADRTDGRAAGQRRAGRADGKGRRSNCKHTEEQEADDACAAEQARLEAVWIEGLLRALPALQVIGREVVDPRADERRGRYLVSGDAPEVVPVVPGAGEKVGRGRGRTGRVLERVPPARDDRDGTPVARDTDRAARHEANDGDRGGEAVDDARTLRAQSLQPSIDDRDQHAREDECHEAPQDRPERRAGCSGRVVVVADTGVEIEERAMNHGNRRREQHDRDDDAQPASEHDQQHADHGCGRQRTALALGQDGELERHSGDGKCERSSERRHRRSGRDDQQGPRGKQEERCVCIRVIDRDREPSSDEAVRRVPGVGRGRKRRDAADDRRNRPGPGPRDGLPAARATAQDDDEDEEVRQRAVRPGQRQPSVAGPDDREDRRPRSATGGRVCGTAPTRRASRRAAAG